MTTGTSDSIADEGYLEAAILSVYDLPTSRQPIAVIMNIGNVTVSTGPLILNFIQSPSSSPIPTPPEAAVAATTATTRRIPNAAGKSATTPTATALAAGRSFASSVGDGVSDNPSPTIRVKLHLDAPYRPEIAAFIAIAQGWFHLVYPSEDWIREPASKIRVPTSSNTILLPLIPLITAIVVASPTMMDTLLVFMPVALPFFIIAITSIVASGLAMYSSTRHGREHIGGTVFIPFADSLLLPSQAAQRLIYQTGPYPMPVSLVRHILPTDPNSLWVSLAIDFVGSSSYLLPVVSKLCNVIWAPIQFIPAMVMYDSVHSSLKYVSLVEELVPFTDIVSTATIGWTMEHYGVHSEATSGSNMEK